MAATDVTVYLRRWDGRTTTGWSEADLEQILGHLSASSTHTAYGQDDVWFAAASPYLLIADARWPVNRRLTELFDVSLDATMPYGLRFTSESAIVDLGEALNQCGWSGSRIEAPADLPQVYMQVYRSQTGLGQYATNLGGGLELVADGGGGPVPAKIHTLGNSESITVRFDELSNAVTFNLTRDIDDLLDILEVRRWKYIMDVLDAAEGTSLVAQSGAASIPGRVLKLKGAGGISLSSDGKYLTITAPEQVLPITVRNVAAGASIVSPLSSVDVINLRGLLSTADVLVQETETDLILALAPDLTTVRRIAPPTSLLTVSAPTLRVDHPAATPPGSPMLELSSAGQLAWRITGAADTFSVTGNRVGAASFSLQTNATVNGLVVTQTGELRLNTPIPLRLQNSAGQTALTINPGQGSADIVLNRAMSVDGQELLSVTGAGPTTVLKTGRVSATAVSTPSLELTGSTSGITLQANNVPMWTIEAYRSLTGGAGLQIQVNSALSGATPVWVPIATFTDQQIFNVRQLEVSTTASAKDLSVTGDSTVANVSSSGQVRAASFRLQSETTPLPSAADFAALQARVAVVETKAAGGGGALPFFVDDGAAKAGGVPRYGLYRFSDVNPASFRMRVSSDVSQYSINFAGYGALTTFPSGILPATDFTLETWIYMTQLYGAAIVHVAGTSGSGWYMGLNGGGRFTVETDSPTTSWGDGEFAPDTGSWCYLAVRMDAGLLIMTARQGSRVWSKSYPGVAASRFVSPTSPIFITLGRRFGGDYQYRHLISNTRWTDRALGVAELYQYPLDIAPNTSFCCQDNPAKNVVTGVQLGPRGTGVTVVQPMTDPLGSYIP